MRISSRRHSPRSATGFGREKLHFSGVGRIVAVPLGVRIYSDESRLEHDPPQRFYVDLIEAEVRELARRMGIIE